MRQASEYRVPSDGDPLGENLRQVIISVIDGASVFIEK